MKLTPLNVLMISTGAILIYCGIKAYKPQDVIQWGLGGKKPESFVKPAKDPMGDNKDNPDPGQRYPGDQGLPPDDVPDDQVPA
jgi:hypothetical protein